MREIPNESPHEPRPEPRTEDAGVRLMLAFQAGREAAFDELVERYSGPVYGLLTRFLGPVAAREDLVQEVFLRVLQARERYRPSARFGTWLYRIAFNLCANERARGHRGALGFAQAPGRAAAEAPEDLDHRADPEAAAPWQALERADVVGAVRRAIAALPERQRMALVLARYEGLSHEEIGHVFGVSDRAIKSLVHRAREALRAHLAPFLTEQAP